MDWLEKWLCWGLTCSPGKAASYPAGEEALTAEPHTVSTCCSHCWLRGSVIPTSLTSWLHRSANSARHCCAVVTTFPWILSLQDSFFPFKKRLAGVTWVAQWVV